MGKQHAKATRVHWWIYKSCPRGNTESISQRTRLISVKEKLPASGPASQTSEEHIEVKVKMLEVYRTTLLSDQHVSGCGIMRHIRKTFKYGQYDTYLTIPTHSHLFVVKKGNFRYAFKKVFDHHTRNMKTEDLFLLDTLLQTTNSKCWSNSIHLLKYYYFYSLELNSCVHCNHWKLFSCYLFMLHCIYIEVLVMSGS